MTEKLFHPKEETIEKLEKLLQLLHPFMPFLSEEIWHLIKTREEDIIVSNWPRTSKVEESLLNDFNIVSGVISAVRNFRRQKNIPHKIEVSLLIKENKSA